MNFQKLRHRHFQGIPKTTMLSSLSSLLTLSLMEIVLGIDNIIFVAILVAKLPASQQARARTLGISLALITRLLLLFSISWLMRLTAPLFSLAEQSFSGRDLILLLGGLFLIGKATFEIHDKLESGSEEFEAPLTGSSATSKKKNSAFGLVLLQIIILDIVFSLDSVITAVGMAQDLWVMVTAMVIAVGVMLLSAASISDFVHRHPTLKILALSFLVLIGVTLVAEGMGQHISKGYIYFAMAFSLVIEALNMAYRKRQNPVRFREPYAIAPRPNTDSAQEVDKRSR